MPERFEDAIKALRHISRGNGNVMRIADRIVAAHERELAVAKLGADMQVYDVDGNERHKAACELRDMKIGKLSTHWNFVCSLAARLNIPRPKDEIYEDYELHELIRDKLVSLLEGERNFSTPEGYMACEDGDQNPAEMSPDEQTSVTLGTRSPITGELRELLADINWTEILDHVHTNGGGTCDGDWLDHWHEQAEHVCDAIDSVHAQLERENESLKVELDRVLGELDESATMPLPLDMDGKPIHIGDVMQMDGDSELREVEGFYKRGFLAWLNGRFVPCTANLYRHATPDTWERIIEDAIRGDGCTYGCLEERFNAMVPALVARCKNLAGDDK